MDGIFIKSKDYQELAVDQGGNYLSLLAKRDDIEIMVQTLLAHAAVWIDPAEDRDTMEFFYVLSGALSLVLPSETTQLTVGDYFFVDGLENEVYIKTEVETKLLYVTNKPLFDDVFGYQGDLDELMRKIDEKDNYTYQHCRNVMDYSIHLLREMGQNAIDDIAVAALFHDVGKCFLPDEVLKKTGRLTPGDFKCIRKHPVDSARLIRNKFGERIAEMALCHHERLDGSGYPYGLTADEIPLEAKIIAVADAFDAMTTQRTYNVKKTYKSAAQELVDMPGQFDANVAKLLLRLVENGEICENEGTNEG